MSAKHIQFSVQFIAEVNAISYLSALVVDVEDKLPMSNSPNRRMKG